MGPLIEITLGGIDCLVELQPTAAEPDVGINEGWEILTIEDPDGKPVDIEPTEAEWDSIMGQAGSPSEYYEGDL